MIPDDNKPILAIETSEKVCGVCLYFDNNKYLEFSLSLKNAHSEKIFELIDQVFAISKTDISEVGSIAVSAGPGSFTGLRIGMSTAKGLAFGSTALKQIPLIPVPTFEAMALQLCGFLPEGTVFIIANKVNSEEIYFAKFQVKDNNYIFLQDLCIVHKDELAEISKNILCFGNVSKDKDYSSFSVPSPKYIAKWCEKFGEDLLTFDYDFLEPNYLKDFIIKGMMK